ncbi:hypothetical protein JK361_09960 [Streptomyces sp. 5-8]|uniref:Uncharacterized protein n=1 Tax=Streptomyces musisoli TaxID=2802280 RepID=A0ABS1NXT0_9ACTN|nr:hypothetical protein [Streptomyces musisoli]MBL1104914.1 hypothetical protein [Streptomyces musisoli]
MEWKQWAFYEATGGDRVSLLSWNDGHWAVCWAYAAPHSGMQLVSYDEGRAKEVFDTSREQAEAQEGLSFDSRAAWQNGSL